MTSMPTQAAEAPLGRGNGPAQNDAEAFHGQYERFETEVLGESPSSVVYRGYDFQLQRYVAIKVLREGMPGSDAFWRYAQFSASLNHGGLVSVYNIDRERGWVIRELMPHGLAEAVENSKPDALRAMLEDALAALTHVHEHDRWHGAVCPSNLLIGDGGRLKLSDPRGHLPGGPLPSLSEDLRHVAPEILHPAGFGEPGPASDLYCLATSFIHAAIGTKRYDKLASSGYFASVDWAQWHASAQTEFPPVGELTKKFDGQTNLVLDRMLQKRVEDRFSSARAALAELRSRPADQVAAVDGLSAEEPPPRPGSRVILHVAPNAGIGLGVSARKTAGTVNWTEWKYRLLELLAAHKAKCLAALFALTLMWFLLPAAVTGPQCVDIAVVTDPEAELQAVSAEGDIVEATQATEGPPFLRLRPGEIWQITARIGDGRSAEYSDVFYESGTVELPLQQPAALERDADFSISLEVRPATATVEMLTGGVWTDITDLLTKESLSSRDNGLFGTVVIPGDPSAPIEAIFRATAPGFATREKPVEVDDQHGSLELFLERERRVIVIVENTSARNIRVEMNGVPMIQDGTNRFIGICGPDVVRARQLAFHASADGYESEFFHPDTSRDLDFPFDFKLRLTEAIPVNEPQLGRLRVMSRPPGAAIMLDGQPTGLTTPAVVTAPAGPHDFRLVLPQFAVWTQTAYHVEPMDETGQQPLQVTLQPRNVQRNDFSPAYYRQR